MSLPRLDARMARLEARRVRPTSPARLVIVPQYEGQTRDEALRVAGDPPAALGRVVFVRVVYTDAEIPPDAL